MCVCVYVCMYVCPLHAVVDWWTAVLGGLYVCMYTCPLHAVVDWWAAVLVPAGQCGQSSRSVVRRRSVPRPPLSIPLCPVSVFLTFNSFEQVVKWVFVLTFFNDSVLCHLGYCFSVATVSSHQFISVSVLQKLLLLIGRCHQYFDTVGWAAGRASGL